MSKTKIILASTLSVLAVASVTTAAVVVTQKRKKQSDSPKTGNEGNQVVVASDSKFEYTLNAEQTKELTAKLLLVKGQDVTVTLTENNTSKTITTKVKEDGTVDFSSLKDGKTYTVTKIVVKEGEKQRDLIAEVKAPKEKTGDEVQPGDTAKPTDPANEDGKKPGDTTKPTEPNQGDNPSANAGTDAGKGPETGGTGAGKDQKDPTTPTEGTGAKPSENKPGTSTDQPTTPSDQPDTSTDKPAAPSDQPAAPTKPEEGTGSETRPSESQPDSINESSSQGEQVTPGPKKSVLKLIQAKYDKSNGIIDYYFEASNEIYDKLRKADKNITLVIESDKTQQEKFSPMPLGSGVTEYITLLKDKGNSKVFVIDPLYYFTKAKNTPEGKYTLISLYVNGEESNNLLGTDLRPSVDVKYN